MKLKSNIALSDTGFLFNPSSGESFSLNPVGSRIIEMLKDGNPFSEIKKDILDTYNTDEATFEKDFYDFLGLLKHHRLLDYDTEKED